MKELLLLMKTKIAALLSVLAAFLIPIKPLLLTVGLFIIADTVLGVYRAKKKKEKITSRKLSQVVSKMVLYQGAVLLFFLLETFILGDFVNYFVEIPLFLTKCVAATLCFIEVKSIDESYTSLTGVSIWDRFKKMLARAKEIKGEIKDLSNKD